LADRFARLPQRCILLHHGASFGFLALMRLDCGTRGVDERAEPPGRIGIDLERCVRRRLAPFVLGVCQALGGIRYRRGGGDRFDARKNRRDAMLPLFERRPARSLRLFNGLQHGTSPLCD
jgi:hypothetical protein